MKLSFFTKRAEYTSKRLRFIARGLQVFGVLSAAVIVATMLTLSQSIADHWPQGMREAYLRQSGVWALGRLLSYFFIGRALLRRQRIGAYVAVATIGVPLAFRLISMRELPALPLVINAFTFGIPLVTLGLIVSVWRELGTVRESEMVDHGPEPEAVPPLTPRNRGFGEPRSLPPHAMLDLPTQTAQPIPDEVRR